MSKEVFPNKSNFLKYAVENYTNPICLSPEEFFEDIGKIKYIKRLLKRYTREGDLKERLLLNHIISFFNVFELNAASHMLFFKMDKTEHSSLKTFLSYLNYIPNGWYEEIPKDKHIQKILEDI